MSRAINCTVSARQLCAAVALSAIAPTAAAQTDFSVDMTVPYDTLSPLTGTTVSYTLSLNSAYDAGITPLLGFRGGGGVAEQRWPNGNFGLATNDFGFTITFSEPGTITITHVVDADPSYRGGGMQEDHWRLTGNQGEWELVDNETPYGIQDDLTSISGTTLELDWDSDIAGGFFVGSNNPWGSVSLVGGSGLTIRSTENWAGNGGRILFTPHLDLAVALDGPALLNLGESADYTIEISNNSSYPANNVMVDMPLPGGLTLGAVSLPTCANALPCNIGTLAANDSVVLTVSLTAVLESYVDTALMLTASIGSDATEINTPAAVANNTDSLTVTIPASLTPEARAVPTLGGALGLTMLIGLVATAGLRQRRQAHRL